MRSFLIVFGGFGVRRVEIVMLKTILMVDCNEKLDLTFRCVSQGLSKVIRNMMCVTNENSGWICAFLVRTCAQTIGGCPFGTEWAR